MLGVLARKKQYFETTLRKQQCAVFISISRFRVFQKYSWNPKIYSRGKPNFLDLCIMIYNGTYIDIEFKLPEPHIKSSVEAKSSKIKNTEMIRHKNFKYNRQCLPSF